MAITQIVALLVGGVERKTKGKDMSRFGRLEEKGLIRFRVVQDEEPFDDSFIDTWDDASEEKKETYKKELWERIRNDGVWGIIGEYNIGNGWVHGDSVWGFVGDDWRNSGYDEDVKKITVDCLREAIKSRCRCCMGKGIKKC